MEKLNIALLFGGRSSEHEVSLLSAKSVFRGLDKEKYAITLIEIAQDGRWMMRQEDFFDETAQNTPGEPVMLPPESEGVLCFEGENSRCEKMDVIFPILHGPYGEDGTIQGLLDLANVPYVGAGVLGSAIGIDKDVMNRLLRDAGIPIAKFLVYRDHETIDEKYIIDTLGLPCFVKPAGNGSSIGITKVTEKGGLAGAIQEAFRYDRKILIEEAIIGREIECSVLGNEKPQASLPGEVVSFESFYSYHEKYASDQKTQIVIPAKLDEATQEAVRAIAIQSYQVLECEGMGRVDVFLKENGEILVNEINTIPGFTSYSMYPKLWEATGMPYDTLLNTLIQLAVARHESRKKVQIAHEYHKTLDQEESDWDNI